MRGLTVLEPRDTHRVRRWDAVVLGGALPGLVAAVRMGMRGARVLVLEEDRSADGFEGLREPFLMTGADPGGVLAACLEALGVALIDRRNVRTDHVAYQVVLPDARVNVGRVEWTADELECWGLAGRERALDLLTRLREHASAQSARLLAGHVAAAAARAPLGLARRRGAPEPDAAEPAAAAPTWPDAGSPRLRALFDAQVRALGDFAQRAPDGAARGRLVGAPLDGAAGVAGRERWLRGLLRGRIAALYGDFRRLEAGFRIVSANGLPAVESDASPEICAGRALLVNAPGAALRGAEFGRAEWLRGPDASRRRLTLHLRGRRSLLPLGMAPRVICVRDPAAPMQDANVVCVRVFEREDEAVDLLASAVVPDDDAGRRHLEQIGRSVVSLLPLRDEGWRRVPTAEPLWDTDALLGDADSAHAGVQRPLARVPAYVLDRWASGGLGFDADLLLGWQAGDAAAAALR